jgi:DNA-binding NtrC family response regulator
MQVQILIIDDEDLIRKSLTSVLTDQGYEVQSAATGGEGLAAFERAVPDIVILDINLPDWNGVDLLREFRGRDPSVRVIMITAHGDVASAVEAMKLGAVDFLRKPYELEEILHTVRQAADHVERDRRLDLYAAKDRATFSRQAIIGESDRMKRVWETVEKVAASTTTTVLILGESGTGKELFARAIHHLSDRASAPLVEVNCSSFQENLLENELFGHEKGAYTGASQLKRGLVELSDQGTLFLDEVGETPLNTQAKLLRFIDNRAFRRVGGARDMKVDLRLVTATNANLERAVETGAFRKDLYYRLKVVSIQLPPLRERQDDVIRLAQHFLDHFSREFRKRLRDISPEVVDLFLRYGWPGNVRELKNLIERAVLLESADTLELSHLPDELRVAASAEPAPALAPVLGGPGTTDEDPATPTDAIDNGEGVLTLRERADLHIVDVLRSCDGNRSRAARLLNISRQHLLNRLKELEQSDLPSSKTSDAPTAKTPATPSTTN